MGRIYDQDESDVKATIKEIAWLFVFGVAICVGAIIIGGIK